MTKGDILNSESDDDGGIDQEGMARLITALGEDGLDDFDRAQLVALHGDQSDDEIEETDDENKDEEGVSDEASDSGEEESQSDDDPGSEEEVEERHDGGADVPKPDAEEDEEESEEGEDEDEDEENDIALDEVESVDEDAVPQHKIEIDNKVALDRIRESIKLDPSLPWTETLTVTYPEKFEVDVDDDLQRELAFYKQALHGANTARALASKHNFAFTRPSDYFAEMVKSDVHMERIRQRLLDENASIKRSEEKRKEREGKKFGKQVQVEKLKERQASKKQMEERIKGLKRKRKDVLDKPDGGEDFDVEVEDAIADRPAKRAKGDGRPKLSRKTRDNKYGFGGSKKHSKQNTRDSTDNFGPGGGRGKSGRGGKVGKSNRPGKSKRMSARSSKR
ncbi:Eukaryotic rRNA processing protein EBP2 domain containing protein [Amanita muscaria]